MKKFSLNYSNYIDAERVKIARFLANAINNLIESDEDFMAAIQQIVEYHENKTGHFPVLALAKDDICQQGFNPDALSDDQMRNFANEMSTEDLMESFRFALEYVAENNMNLPELRTEIDTLYKDYKEENQSEPLYATIWLEDKGGNNQSWPEIVKLTLEVDEKQDEQIYMNFDGFEDLKSWLFSTLEEESDSEDCWCYDNPEQRIEFFDELLLDE